jgi:HK97 family phage portal protein
MIINQFLHAIRFRNITAPKYYGTPVSFLQGVETSDTDTTATIESSQWIHVAYRCINILSDDIASMPLQTFEKVGQRMAPNGMQRNISWLLEFEPNRWMNPFIFKKTVTKWLINYGQSYIWSPPARAGRPNELIILPTDRTMQMIDKDGNIWYQVSWHHWEPLYDAAKNPAYYPDIEVVKLLINSEDGVTGRSVLEFARDTMSRQLGASDTQGKLYKQGLNPGGLLWMAGELNKEARKKIRGEYEEQMSGSGNAYRLAIMDPKATKFEQITMKPIDAQFLESIQATDVEIANFYGIPLYKLNLGKQSYESNAQLDLDYMKTTLTAYLSQWESEARRKWLSLDQQNRGFYFKFNRDAILATDANTRATYLEKKIQSGQLTPNEGREIDDLPPYTGGDSHYMPANFGMVNPDGSIQAGSAAPPVAPKAKNKAGSNGNGHHELVGEPLFEYSEEGSN